MNRPFFLTAVGALSLTASMPLGLMNPKTFVATILLAASSVTLAQTPVSTAGAVASTTPMSEGEVRKVDKEAAKLTLRHGPILNLNMPAMTMVFRVLDPKLLAAVKEGDKVRFVAQNVDGSITVTRIEKAK